MEIKSNKAQQTAEGSIKATSVDCLVYTFDLLRAMENTDELFL